MLNIHLLHKGLTAACLFVIVQSHLQRGSLAALQSADEAAQALSPKNLREIAQTLPHHRIFSYASQGTLPETFFETAARSLDDGYLYLVITRSKSAPSEFIGLFTHRAYNHVSLAFDEDLQTLISYSGGENALSPGLNAEQLHHLTQRDGASAMVYRLPASHEQKRQVLDKVRLINRQGSAYNLLGLLLKIRPKQNSLFCSQFVYLMLERAGLNYFHKNAAHVTPTDFVELDYFRKLDFVETIK